MMIPGQKQRRGLRAGARQRVGGHVARGSSAVGVCALAAMPCRRLDDDAVTSIPPELFDHTPTSQVCEAQEQKAERSLALFPGAKTTAVCDLRAGARQRGGGHVA